MKITFPISIEAFNAQQERLLGRALGNNERDVTPVVVDATNGAYDDGLQGVELWPQTVEQLFEAGRFSRKPFMVQFATALVNWVHAAYTQGQLDAEKAVEVAV